MLAADLYAARGWLRGEQDWTIGVIAMVIGVSVFSMLGPRITAWSTAHDQYYKSPLHELERRVTIEDSGITLVVGQNIARSAWSNYSAWTEINEVFLIDILQSSCAIIPKRAMSEEQIVELRALLTEKIGPMGVARKAESKK